MTPFRRTHLLLRLGLLLAAGCLLNGEAGRQRAEAAVLLPYGTNVGRVVAVEVNYMPERPLLQVAVTTDGSYVKRGEYSRDPAIQAVLDLLRFKERGRLYVVYDENRIVSFFVQQ